MAAQPKTFYDESNWWMDEWMDGCRNVYWGGDRRGCGGPAGHDDLEAVHEIIVRSRAACEVDYLA
jgi:hypothetical protein